MDENVNEDGWQAVLRRQYCEDIVMVKDDKKEKIKLMLAGKNTKLWCGFCNKTHTSRKDACSKFIDLITRLDERE
jgi:hypothetical protein